MAERHREVGLLLAEPDALKDGERFRALSREYAELGEVVAALADYDRLGAQLADTRALAEGSDAELAVLAREELVSLAAAQAEVETTLERLLIPKDPRDDANLFLEIRAGTGGDEAAIFAGDLYRMYGRYAERRGWRVELLSANPGEHGGFREVISRVEGRGAYAWLKYESGTHRVQRVPATESQGRIHTSAATVAVLPELDEIEDIALNPADLKIDTFRASGAGGQHVNKTDSAIRVTHLPTGLVVECQDERSQHKNRARALSLLKSRLLEAEQSKQQSQIAAERKLMVGSGDRSQRIRTYNFPQGRLTDHRINLTLYQLDQIVEGDLDPVLTELRREAEAEQLAELSR
jgi:peptide chain release factor 1